MRLSPLSDGDILHRRQSPHQLHDAVGQQIVGVLHRAATQDVGGVQCHPHPSPLFQVARLSGQTQAPLKHLTHLVVQDQLGPEHLKGALGKGTLLNLNPQGHLPPDVKVGSGLGLSVAHLVVGLQQQRRGQQAGRYAGATIVQTIQLAELSVAEQLPSQRGQQTVKGVPAHQVEIQPIRLPQAPLIRPLAQHNSSPNRQLGWPGV